MYVDFPIPCLSLYFPSACGIIALASIVRGWFIVRGRQRGHSHREQQGPLNWWATVITSDVRPPEGRGADNQSPVMMWEAEDHMSSQAFYWPHDVPIMGPWSLAHWRPGEVTVVQRAPLNAGAGGLLWLSPVLIVRIPCLLLGVNIVSIVIFLTIDVMWGRHTNILSPDAHIVKFPNVDIQMSEPRIIFDVDITEAEGEQERLMGGGWHVMCEGPAPASGKYVSEATHPWDHLPVAREQTLPSVPPGSRRLPTGQE